MGSPRWLAHGFVASVLCSGCTGGLTPSGTPGNPGNSSDGDTEADVGEGSTSLAFETTGGTWGDESSGDESSEDDTAGESGEAPYEPARYPAGRIHSPITPFVGDRLRDIASRDASGREDVFLKAGASSTVSTNTLFCFADDAETELGEHDDLADALAYYRAGDAAGSTPFDRVSLAAEVGRGAGWVIDGDPSPLAAETDALEPRVALVHYGTNDMGLGTTYATALHEFYEHMMALTDELEARGVVPVLFGITRRGDSQSAQRWVETYNAVIRGIAQARQVPFVDLYAAIDPLPGHGLGSDGLHLEAFEDGACRLTDAGLEHGYNVRNLVALQALDRAMRILVDDADQLDAPELGLGGDGSIDAPLRIDGLPWADVRDTSSGTSLFDVYECAADVDESGPEFVYRLELTDTTRLRAIVLDREDVDIDLQLLDDSATPESCLARDHRMLEGTLGPGTYHIVLDSWVDDAQTSWAGPYLFVVVECAPDDTDCDVELAP